ncbi:MAG: hypothetical protein RMI45_08415 [Ignisphaera sp.]|nr:hypothetical protein [Ignisphaera sp.]
MDRVREYVYRDRKTGEIYISLERVEDPELELITIVEIRPYGGRRATSTTHT